MRDEKMETMSVNNQLKMFTYEGQKGYEDGS